LVNDLGVLHETLERDPVDLEYIGENLDSGEISKSLANSNKTVAYLIQIVLDFVTRQHVSA
jgi:hypothetical protein